jgi:phenylacetate-CoA ligase
VSSVVVFEWLWHKRDVSLQVAAFRVNRPDNDKAPKNLALTYIGNPSHPVIRESTHRTAPQLLDELEKIQPHYLYTNGLMLRLMAIEQLRKPRHIKHLKEVWSVSDLIESTTRSLIKQAFGVRVVDRYSTEEFGVIALQCPVDDHLHVLAPRFVVEVLDENGVEVEIGKPGRAIITSLTGKIQPLLRYEIGDILVLGSKCRGGYTWPIIEKILGRNRQTFKTKKGEEKFVTLVGSPLLDIREILDFKLIIFTDSFVIVINCLDSIDSNMHKRVTDAIHDTFKEKRTVRILQSSDPKMFKNWKRKEFEIIDTALKNNLEDVELHEYLLQFAL